MSRPARLVSDSSALAKSSVSKLIYQRSVTCSLITFQSSVNFNPVHYSELNRAVKKRWIYVKMCLSCRCLHFVLLVPSDCALNNIRRSGFSWLHVCHCFQLRFCIRCQCSVFNLSIALIQPLSLANIIGR